MIDALSVNDRNVRLLFLCTHNSARSQIAEAVARHLGEGRVDAFSAGTHPARVHPDALKVLEKHGIDTGGLHSKSLAQFRESNFDCVITVCDNARDACPLFSNASQQLHWSFPDPSAHQDQIAREQAFSEVLAGMNFHISKLLEELTR
jgi:protein-tyrosine-phosphatase